MVALAPVTPLVALLLVSVAVGAAAAILAWRERPEPGTNPLVALLVGQTWWSTCIVFQLRAPTVSAKLLWTELAWLGVVVIPVAWVLFAMEYTGRDQYVQPRFVALLSVVPAITVVLAMTSGYHDLLTAQVVGTGPNGVVRIEEGGAWYWVIAAYTYLLGVVGMVPILGLVTSNATTFRGQGAALVVAALAPWVTNLLFLAGALPTSGIDPTPVAFSVSGAGCLFAITQFRLLGTSPAPNQRARRVLVDRMREGIVVVDTNDHVVDVNESCVDVFGLAPRELLGRHAADVIPEYDRLPEDGSLQGYLTVGGEGDSRSYDVVVTRISNVRGNPIGRVISFHDVSRHLRQQERLKVLNRVLRHNIRTETNVIHGYAERFSGKSARIVQDRAMQIEALGEKGREAIELFERAEEGYEPRSIDEILRQSLSDVRAASPDCEVDYEPPAEDVAVADLLRPVFSNVLENAVQHNPADTPHVRVRVRRSGESVCVEVADDGPGIGEYELSVLAEGTETALRHGSGLGLWIAKWGVDIVDGDIAFAENEPAGTVVTITVPVLAALSAPGEEAERPEATRPI
ncbi:MAG: histidine kinase N-terminal 7TM domain-containing protein [Haloferacaceae archaeon]